MNLPGLTGVALPMIPVDLQLRYEIQGELGRGATVVAATPATIGKWAYAALERLKKTDEQYLLLYRQHLAAKSATESPGGVGRIGP